MKNRLRMLLAIVFWCGLAVIVWQGFWSDAATREQTARWTAQMAQYSTGTQTELQLQLPAQRELAVGDPIFVQNDDGTLRQIGQIKELCQASQALPTLHARVSEARAQLYPSAPAMSDEARLTYLATPDSLAWVVETMLPAEKRAQIASELSTAFAAHRTEIIAALRPVVEQSVRESLMVIEEELPLAFERHRAELEAIGARYHKDLVEGEVVPLVQEEIWPIVRRHGEPVAAEVSRQMWEHVSLWRFGWRYMYDRSPLPEKGLTEKEFQRFKDTVALPVLQEHTDDFLRAVENSLKDTARNPRVRAALRRNLVKIMEDPELQAVLGTIFREVIVDNPRLREALERQWNGPQAQAAFQLAGQRLEPTVRRLGDLVFGSPTEGISPEFAAVLRNQILHKDRRWLLLEDPGVSSAGSVNPRRVTPVRFASPEVSARLIGGRVKPHPAG